MGRWGGGGHRAASACSLRLSEVEEVAVQGAQAEARANARAEAGAEAGAGAGAGAGGGAEADDPEAEARDSEVAKRALVEMEEAAYRYLAQVLEQLTLTLTLTLTLLDQLTLTLLEQLTLPLTLTLILTSRRGCSRCSSSCPRRRPRRSS